MDINNIFVERDIVIEYTAGISKKYKKKKLMRRTIIHYNPETRKGKIISQILDAVKRLL